MVTNRAISAAGSALTKARELACLRRGLVAASSPLAKLPTAVPENERQDREGVNDVTYGPVHDRMISVPDCLIDCNGADSWTGNRTQSMISAFA
jgi:hypothetical protein